MYLGEKGTALMFNDLFLVQEWLKSDDQYSMHKLNII